MLRPRRVRRFLRRINLNPGRDRRRQFRGRDKEQLSEARSQHASADQIDNDPPESVLAHRPIHHVVGQHGELWIDHDKHQQRRHPIHDRRQRTRGQSIFGIQNSRVERRKNTNGQKSNGDDVQPDHLQVESFEPVQLADIVQRRQFNCGSNPPGKVLDRETAE